MERNILGTVIGSIQLYIEEGDPLAHKGVTPRTETHWGL